MKQFILVLIAIALLVSCSDDEDKAGKVILTFEGVNQTMKPVLKYKAEAEVIFTDFKLSIRDIEFKKDESDLDSNEVEFRGPFDIDLMSETDALAQTLGTVEVPDGTYKIVRFKLHKSTERAMTDVLYDRSIYMKGTIDGIPFEFWHDTSENFDVENMGGIVVNGNTIEISVQFVMDQFLNSLYSIDLSTATDDDQDNLIEINPDDDDNNGDIADDLKENIKESANLIKI